MFDKAVLLLCAIVLATATQADKQHCTKDDPDGCEDTKLPDWCYNPVGEDCSFYKECLEKRYPCEKQGKSKDYAIECGMKFCTLFQTAYNKFTKDGQRWIDGVRKCLQNKLVHFLRPEKEPTCDEILKEAFATHAGCYLEPAPGVPSICDLGWKDRMRLMWTVKGSLLDLSIIKLVIKQMVEVASTCLGNDDGDILSDMFTDA